MSWRDDVGAGAYTPVRAGWEILDAARSIAFTGVIEFPLLPSAQVYLDRGRIYFAERSGDPDVADRLVAMGVVRPDDLARGVVVSAGHDHRNDHLGLLFDRVPTLDRSRVVLALEHVTGDTVAWIAGQSVAEAVSRPYVYHPSGVHQWYQPSSAITSPLAAFPAPRLEQRIERVGPADPAPAVSEPPVPAIDDEVVQDAADEPARQPIEPRIVSPVGQHVDRPGDERIDQALDEPFEVRWPSGEVGSTNVTEQAPSDGAITVPDGLDRFAPPVAGTGPGAEELDDDPVDHEMTIAVRRAMAAVSAGKVRGRAVSPVVPVLDDVPDPFDVDDANVASEPSDDSDDPFAAFGHDLGDPLAVPLPSRGGSVQARRTALQRLIDGLRNG